MRRREYDVVRGLAVIFMIAVHVIGAVFIAPFGDTLKFGTCAYFASVAVVLCLCTLIGTHGPIKGKMKTGVAVKKFLAIISFGRE